MALTQQFYTAYEVGTPAHLIKEKNMDMHNNLMGANIGATFPSVQPSNIPFSYAAVIVAVKTAINSGYMVKLSPITPLIFNNTPYMNTWWEYPGGPRGEGHHGITSATQLTATTP
jgi:hypothetical protein